MHTRQPRAEATTKSGCKSSPQHWHGGFFTDVSPHTSLRTDISSELSKLWTWGPESHHHFHVGSGFNYLSSLDLSLAD